MMSNTPGYEKAYKQYLLIKQRVAGRQQEKKPYPLTNNRIGKASNG